MHRCPPIGRPTGRRIACWLALGATTLAMQAAAATRSDPPDGLPAGRVIFTPWIGNEVLADDNLFRRNENQDPRSDVETTVSVGVDALVPFRMSWLSIGYEGAGFYYREDNVESSESHEGTLQFTLNSSNHHTFVFDGSYNRGVTQRQTLDQNQEIVRQGIPLIHRQFAFEWLRQVPQRPSWRARLEQTDQTYNTVEAQPWLDYDGWTFDWEYGQPLHRRGFLSAKLDVRRQDQFESGLDSLLVDPLRREAYDGVEVGYRGLVGLRQPLYLTVGYGRLEYLDVAQGDRPTNYSGVVGTATWRLPVGGNSNLNISALRRPLSSFYNTYYLINEMRVRFDHPVGQASRYGLTTLFSRNRYGAPVFETITGFTAGRCVEDLNLPDRLRRDSRQHIEGFWEWTIQPRMMLRFTAGHNRRSTNCDSGFGAYTSNSLGVLFRLGWFD